MHSWTCLAVKTQREKGRMGPPWMKSIVIVCHWFNVIEFRLWRCNPSSSSSWFASSSSSFIIVIVITTIVIVIPTIVPILTMLIIIVILIMMINHRFHASFSLFGQPCSTLTNPRLLCICSCSGAAVTLVSDIDCMQGRGCWVKHRQWTALSFQGKETLTWWCHDNDSAHVILQQLSSALDWYQ